METTTDGTFFQEGDHVRLKHTNETGRINATAGGVAYVLMDRTEESRLFAAYVDADAEIELVPPEDTQDKGGATPFTEHLSEQWLLERTYHAQLSNGSELSVPLLTEAMKQLSDFSEPVSAQSSRSKLPELLPMHKSGNFSVPLSTWKEITQDEARAAYQQGSPVLLYSEHNWQHMQQAASSWRPNHNSRVMIFGNALVQPEAIAGIDVAVCYVDAKRGTFSNASWKTWFPADAATIFADDELSTVTFLRPTFQFPYTTHYTVVTSDGHIHEYADREEAQQGFTASPLQELHIGNAMQMGTPHFCYYHEISCPSGVYRIEFFGPRMDEPAYPVKKGS